MSEWKINLVSGIIALVFGIFLVLFSTTLTIPSLKSTTLNCGLLLTGGGLNPQIAESNTLITLGFNDGQT